MYITYGRIRGIPSLSAVRRPPMVWHLRASEALDNGRQDGLVEYTSRKICLNPPLQNLLIICMRISDRGGCFQLKGPSPSLLPQKRARDGWWRNRNTLSSASWRTFSTNPSCAGYMPHANWKSCQTRMPNSEKDFSPNKDTIEMSKTPHRHRYHRRRQAHTHRRPRVEPCSDCRLVKE